MKRIASKHNPYLAALAFHSAEFTLGVEGSNIRNVSIQLLDADGAALLTKAHVSFYITSDADGNTIHAVPVDTIAIGTNGIHQADVAGLSGKLITEDNGIVDVNLTQDAAATNYYMNLLLPDGSVYTSPVIAFA